MAENSSQSSHHMSHTSSQSGQSPDQVLASFVLAIDLSDISDNPEYRAWSQDTGFDPETYLWTRRIALSHRVEREVQDRLQLARYGRYVRFSLKIQRGSITAVATLLLVGKTLVDFVIAYGDFFDGLNRIVETVQSILGRNVVGILASGGGPIPSTDVHVRVEAVNTAALPTAVQPPPTHRILWSPRQIARNLLRAVGILILGYCVFSGIPATRSFVGELWALPDLIHQILYLDTGDGQVRQAHFVVANQGIGPAQEVYINIDIMQSSLASYRIIPQEAYQLVQVDLEQGVVRMALERLAAGAMVEVLVSSNESLSLGDIRFSAVSKSGVSQALRPQARNSELYGLSYVPPGDPFKQVAAVFTRHLEDALVGWRQAATLQANLSEEDFFAIIFSEEFLLLASAGLVIAILAGMIFNSQVFLDVILLETLTLVFMFFYPYRVPANLIIFIIFYLAVIAFITYYAIARKRGELSFSWRGGSQWPYLSPQALVLLVSLFLVVSLLCSLVVFSGIQVSMIWLIVVLVAVTGGVIYLVDTGHLSRLLRKL